MIKLIILIFLVLLLFFIKKLYLLENFHEKTISVVAPNQPEFLPNCEVCSYCDFTENPETKDYIISRCLMQHTQTNDFKPNDEKCRPHSSLAISSGCTKAIKHFRDNIENLHYINIKDSNQFCKCMYSLDDIPSEQNSEKNSFNSWIKSF